MSAHGDLTPRGESTCGCCAGLRARTPAQVVNRPGLSAIAYRAGTHAQFKQSLLAALSDAARPALARLTTRDDDDFSIALLDAWATVADVLTFYQERIANECYLRTATEDLSIVELTRALGYELAPGVAAGAYLAFALEDGPGAPGYATIDAGTKVQSVPGPGETAQTFETIEKLEAKAAWNEMRPKQTGPQALSLTMPSVVLEGADLDLKPGDMLLISAFGRQAMRRIESVDVSRASDRTEVKLEGADGDVEGDTEGAVWALRVAAAPFGHNAPLQMQFVDDVAKPSEWSLDPVDQQAHVMHLDGLYDRVRAGDWIVMDRPAELGKRLIGRVGEQQPVFRQSYGLAGRVTQLTLGKPWFDKLPDGADLKLLRQIAIYTQSEELTPAEVPLKETVSDKSIPLDRAYEGLAKGRIVLFSGKNEKGEEAGETAVLEASDDPAKLSLKEPLEHTYQRAGLVIYGNVAPATHGETRTEVLGSGDAGRVFQRFALRHSPLTYVPADTPSGGASTLEVRVNDLLWQEVPTLQQCGPRDRVYITRRDAEGKTAIQFGDGRAGARPATGQENIRAVYREGLGLDGMVDVGQLSLLMTRPLGVKAVTNPRAAEGAQDPERKEQARGAAPRSVLTLGRIVSLEDYADFACGFAGIAKALATWTWHGDARGVLVTLAAGSGDHALGEGSLLHSRLLEAMEGAGDPHVPIQLKSYAEVLFTVAASVQVDEPTYIEEKVLAEVRSALARHFSFEAREFGQGVALSEVIAVIQAVPGVVMVDVDRLDGPGALPPYTFLTASVPAPGAPAETVQPAELLILDTNSLDEVKAR